MIIGIVIGTTNSMNSKQFTLFEIILFFFNAGIVFRDRVG